MRLLSEPLNAVSPRFVALIYCWSSVRDLRLSDVSSALESAATSFSLICCFTTSLCPETGARKAEFSPHCAHVVTINDNWTLQVWDATTGEPVG